MTNTHHPIKLPVKFVPKDKKDFFIVLTQRINAYFKEKEISKFANGTMVFKTIFFMVGVFTLYGLIISQLFNPLVMLALAILLGSFKAFLAFNVGHDAIHGSYSESKLTNQILSKTFDFLGANSYMWSITHNKVHHTYTNIPGHDEDIDLAPGIIRLCPDEPWKPMMKYQKYYAFLLYGLAGLFRIFKQDYYKFFKKEIGSFDNTNHPKIEYFNLFFYKLVYYSIFIFAPLYFIDLPIITTLLGFIIMMLTEGFVLGLVFQLAHVVEDVDFPEPTSENHIEEVWAIHQLQTTANFARKNWLATFLCGGLNYQVEHHLFPNICHIHYPAMSHIVKSTAEEYDIIYNENETFFSALQSHFNMLTKFGKQPN
ncbi:MAG: acyl-CoA desaturase [Cytophagales bacterium]|nr:acyl-CoA desaturase [Cytophagales bacterium]